VLPTVGLTFGGQEKTPAVHWPILTSYLADVLEPLQSGCVLDKCAGRGFVERSRGRPSPRGRHPPPSTAQRASLAGAASDPPARQNRRHRTPRPSQSDDLQQGRSHASCFPNNEERRGDSPPWSGFAREDPFHSTVLASRRYRLVRWLNLSHVKQVPASQADLQRGGPFHSRGTSPCGGTIGCRVTSDLQIHARRAPTRQAPGHSTGAT
jgi:hypothetical protein